jgi:hypothetical protein
MSGGTLPKTGAGALTIGGMTVTTTDLAVYGLLAVVAGVLLVALALRVGWRRGKAASEA